MRDTFVARPIFKGMVARMLLAGFAAAWLLGGCAKPPPAFESAIDPAVAPHAAVDRVMVFGAGVSEADRRAIEAALQTAAGVAGIVTLSGGGREPESIEAVVALATGAGRTPHCGWR